jgi:hypothetical protein
MSEIIQGRYTGRIDGPFVLFLIGMRVNKPWAVHQLAPVFAAMPRMIEELYEKPDWGFLGTQVFFSLTQPVLIQYWRDFDSLVAYAHDRSGAHFPAWADFNRKVARTGAVGVWHETYRIEAGAHEGMYVNMPKWGLGAARGVDHVKAEGRLAKAADRMRGEG